MSRKTDSFASEQKMSTEKDALSDLEANRRVEPDREPSAPHDTVSQPTDIAEDGETQWLQGFPLVVIMMALTIVSYLMLLDVSIVSTALPKITNEFNSLPDIGWYAAAYQLASAALQPLSGKVYTHFTAKWTLLGYFFIFEIGSLVCALATSSDMLIVGRALAGMGSSGISTGCVTIMAGIAPLHKRSFLLGIMMGIGQFGLASGPLVGGALSEYTTWRWCFWINLPIGAVVALLVVFIRIPDSSSKEPPMRVLRTLHKTLDLVGVAGLAGSVTMLLLAVQFGGNEHPWNSATIIGLFCGAGLTFLLWVAWTLRMGENALIPLGWLKKRVMWTSCITFGLTMGSLLTTSYFLPVYFQGVLGASPLMSGVQVLPNIIPQLLMVSKMGYYIPSSLLGAALFSIGAGLISTYSPTTPLAKRIGYQVLLGSGYGFALQMPILAVQNSIQLRQLPIAMGILMFCSQISGSLLVTFGNTIFYNSLRTLIPKYAPSVDPIIVVSAGATQFREIVPQAALDNVLIAYAKSVDRVYYLGVGCGVATFVSAWGMGWVDIRKTKKPEASTTEESQMQGPKSS
ncbi:hypothetical protein ED733_006174 [Metarhizium rileyi]|uniref:Major facilitator superfamily (MFS) profile domain-containing protein n=1 Tax=Metarhizium rileyi (strain RCEF 4871) TaxID=1649241 RepID=A0A5C6GHV9_METRR|nr:hypothetical protein ED733_006174 [Metarhizium rileyi]